MKKQLFSLLLAGVAMAPAWAVPARRAFVDRIGPDGTTVSVQLVGDEFGHYYVDADGRAMISDGDRLVYASETEIASRVERRDARFRARNKQVAARRNVPGQIGTFPGTSFPAHGKQKAVVILVEFKDQAFKLGSDEKALQYFTDMLNKDGFSEQGATGSVHEYFIDSSNGRFDCQFDVFGPVTLKNNMRYYGGNDSSGNDLHPEEMVIEACDALDSRVDFSEYDRDGDGVIDNVYVIYAGQGEASGGSSNTVWPHSWDVTAAGYNKTYDGVKLATYGCSNEWEDYVNDGKGGPDGIGTFTHEFSHILGLPDLYHTTNAYATFTPGAWSVLDYGPYNNDGRTPPAYSTFERNALGWIELTELTAESGSVNIPELNASNTAYCITNPRNSSEFYLLETRDQKGWDAYLPGAGMLIWYVDYDYSDWSNNSVNNTQSHQGVDLIEADGKSSKEDRNEGDCFPGSARVKTYSPKWWTDGSTGIKLSDIVRNAADGSVTFTAGASTGGNTGGDTPDPDAEFYTVAQVQEAALTGKSASVRGYIVGYVMSGGKYSASTVAFSADGCDINSNLVLADSKDESDHEYCIPVQLPKGTCRNELNLMANPANLGRYVELTGTLDNYFNIPGLRNVSSYRFLAEPGQDAIEEVTSVAADAPKGIFDLSGRRVATPGRGLYIIDGRKVLIR